jgi:hypothetical protein
MTEEAVSTARQMYGIVIVEDDFLRRDISSISGLSCDFGQSNVYLLCDRH